MIKYAQVAVNAPVASRTAFTYAVPSDSTLSVGEGVWVPFGTRTVQGIVLAIDTACDVPADQIREILAPVTPPLTLSAWQLELARWLSDNYLAPLAAALSLMLPPGFVRKSVHYFQPGQPVPPDQAASLSPLEQSILADISRRNPISQPALARKWGSRPAAGALDRLVSRGFLKRHSGPEKARVAPKSQTWLRLAVSAAEVLILAPRIASRKPAQARLLKYLAEQNDAAPAAEIAPLSSAAVVSLLAQGLLLREERPMQRHPAISPDTATDKPLALTAEQAAALSAITGSLKSRPAVFLLHGVTGSGKTEVYLQALAAAVAQGRKGIVLVPEIALTPQTIARFAARFPGRVAVLHSRLSLGQQHDEWQRIKQGDCDVVIGPRSALFAPQPDLGLIIMDEEHEWTYKQNEAAPRYHARDVALKLGRLRSATVILGSATPDVVTFYRSDHGAYQRLTLPQRVTPVNGTPLPEVRLVDLKEDLKAGNRHLMSQALAFAAAQAVAAREQVILFINRRGAATFIQCRDCGFTFRCKRCNVPLIYHAAENLFVCHQCNFRIPVPQTCPQCWGHRLKFLGSGTEKLEQEVKLTIPKARLLRWDGDTAKKAGDHAAILKQFTAHEADVLIGTQMVAKGLDIPRVTLVGIINIDDSLNLPDFRAGERAFQLMSQVAGRAGRGPRGGQVIIQTYVPTHYAIRAAAAHDYLAFYQRELAYRRALREPPFSELVRLTYSHSQDDLGLKEALHLKQRLGLLTQSQTAGDIEILGPAPAFIHRLRDHYRWQLVLRGTQPAALLRGLDLSRNWTIDVDPVGLD